MNFIEAVKAALDDNKIRRKDWHHTHYIYCNNNNILFGRFEKKLDHDSKKSYAQILDEEVQYRKYQNEEDKILEKTTYANDWEVTLRVGDYLADDWELARDVKTERDFIEILINPLLRHFNAGLIQDGILDLDDQILFLKGLFKSLENQYKTHHSQKSVVESKTLVN